MDKGKTIRRKGLQLAEQISELVHTAPDTETKRDLYSVVTRIRNRYGLTHGQKRDQVVKYLRLGATTLEELSRETLLSKCDLSPLLRELEQDGTVERRSIQTTGAGRPQQCFFFMGEEDR